MKRFSGLTFIRYARDQKVGKLKQFKFNVSTKIESVRNSTTKIQLRSTLPGGVGTLSFYKISKFINCKFVSKCILGIVVNAEALTTGRMIPSGTNSPPAVVSTQW